MTRIQSKVLVGLSTLTLLMSAGIIGLLVERNAYREPDTGRERAHTRSAPFASRGRPIEPIPDLDDLDPELVALGDRLFHETALSASGDVSCASCHDIASGGDDGRRVSIGVNGAKSRRNAPTVFNSRFNVRFFWDGRARTLEEQLDGPLEDPREMAMTWAQVTATLAADPTYAAAFEEVLGGAPTPDRVRRAIATFERSLTTPHSPFDRFLSGDPSAIGTVAKRGYATFVRVGCITCHQGVNVGGNMIQPLGRMRDYFAADDPSGDSETSMFKVPSLRTVTRTAPYFHDGSVPTLEETVRLMARFQLGPELDPRDVADIIAFLASLDAPIRPRRPLR